MCSSFIVVRSKDDSDATVRLQSECLLRGLRTIPNTAARVVAPSQAAEIENDACVLFHFDDLPAISFLREARSSGKKFLAVCFASDIYEFSRYLPSYEVADLYLTPTPLHKKVLASEFYKPVNSLPEGIDPIATMGQTESPRFPIKQDCKLVWFGYAESFKKGMASLLPVINLHLNSGEIQDFCVIVNEAEFPNEFNYRTVAYRNESFRQEVSGFDYCILSHFSLDLSLNSYIKSPNKLITALMSGIIPIASDTPSYSAILCEFGLDRFLFDSPLQLDRILRTLNPAEDSQRIIDSGIVEALWARLAEGQLARSLVGMIDDLRGKDQTNLADLKLQIVSSPRPQTYFTEHVKDFLPSFVRAVRRRASS